MLNYKFSPYSFSKLNTHQQCNRKFKYQYIDHAPQDYMDRTALFKGSAVHNILENYPNPGTHKLASDYQHIADNFITSDLGKKYLEIPHIVELKIGLTIDLKPCEYSDKNALFRGFVDHTCIIEDDVYETIEVNNLSEIPCDFKVLSVIND